MSEHENPLLDVLNQLNEQKTAAPGNSLLHPNDSFPVLKAFQEYLEAERRKMRQRTTMIVAITAVACLAVLLPLIFVVGISLSGMNRIQDGLLNAVTNIGKNQSRPIPAPVVPTSVARELENNVAEQIRKAVGDVKSEIKAEQNIESTQASAMLLEMQAQLKKMSADLSNGFAVASSTPAPTVAPTIAPVVAPVAKKEPPRATVNPVRPRSDFPELDGVNARDNQQLAQPPEHIPLDLPAGMRETAPRSIAQAAPKPAPVVDAPKPAPKPASTDSAAPLTLNFGNADESGAQAAVLSIPAPDGAVASWRLMIPGGE